jgi:hypothetical protein
MKQLRALFGLALVVVAIYLAWKVFPVYYANYELQDYIERQAVIEAYTQHTEQDIAEVMAKKASELDIPLKPEQFKVQKAGADLTIAADYSVPIDVPIHPFEMHFSVGTKNKRI